ncbi:PrgI family protein [[Ruminococcus] gnavus]|nr:PrgI family protein [Mediterraneibacter gnavus]MDB8723197.1 PrgI family protein [Mediterraneibacter gnavus]
MVDRMDKRKPVKLTRSEKKAMRRTEKLAGKLEKEQERAEKIRRKKEAKRAAREEKRRKKGSRKSELQRKDRKPTPNKRTGKKSSYSEQKSSTGKVRSTDVKRKQERNISAQNSIPYREMAKDGICRVQEKYYSKTIRFYDINYQLAQNEDKNAIFENWCDFLNYFDSTIHFQISFINHHSNMKEFESVIQIQPQNDAFDDVRMEYAQMLRDQLAKGNNGLVRTKYITFGIEAENIREAKPKLERIEADILNNFKVLGVSAYPLNGEERLQILYETFNPEEKVPFQFSYDRILRSGMGTKDFVAPTSFVFKEGKTFQMGNTIGAASYLQILAPELTDKMLAEFLDMDSNLIVNLHIQSIDQMKAIKLVKSKVTDINRMKIEEQKKAVRAGYDMDIIPSDLNTYGGEAKRLLEDLQSRNERMFLVTVLFLNTAKTKQELDNAVFQTAGIAQKYNCSLRRLDYMQEQGLMSSVPLGMNMIPIKRALTTTSTAIFVPFTTQELFMGGESLYYGLNALSNNMIMVDRKKLKNPNGLILGTPGCFTGETKLLLPDGRKVSFLELLAKKEEVLVNSFDFQKQELVKARGYDVRCTKEVTELVEVELENGETVRCTPDHWFLTQSAGYVEACNLKVGAKFIPEHEVKAVRFLNLEEAVPVYDISVEGYQNFLLSCGVVVHNSGKSFAAKREIANVFFATQDDIIIGDPEGEYYPLVHALGGQVIHISPTSHDYINPMDINLDYSDDDNPLGFKSDFILSLCELIMGSRNGIEAEEKSVIDRCLPLVYQKYFENPIPENMPVLGDLYDCLRKQEEVQAQRIATALEIYVNGSLNVFNHHTNVELNNRIVCFDIKDLGKQLKKLGMLIVQDQVWNRVTVNRVAHKSTRYYIDEFHLLLKEEQTAAYSVEIWKRFRKWGGKQSIILKILQRSIVYAVLIEAEGNN